MLGDLLLVTLALSLLLLNAFFVLAEFALVKVRATRLEELAEKGHRDARIARQILSDLDAYLAATQIGITLASLGIGAVGQHAISSLLRRLFDAPGWLNEGVATTLAIVLAFLLLTFLHIAGAELVPRFVAIRHPERTALFVARPLRFYRRLVQVPQAVFNGAARGVLRLLGVPMSSEEEVTYTEEELRSILGASQERGGFSFHHLLLLENAFDFGELRLKDVMVPLPQTVSLDATRPWSENAVIIAEKRLSRYPLRDGPGGKFLGLVHAKTILLDLLGGRTPDLRRDALKLPRASQELLLEAALRKLQKSGEHMGIATDEAGHEVGMFTLEDIVEELIGDIHDEFEASRDVSLVDLLRPDTVILDPLVVDHRELVEMLVRLACHGAPGVDSHVAIEAVHRRDKQVPASVGGSVAVPHARVPGLTVPVGAFARLAEGIDYHAPDGRPVRLVFLILTPGDAAAGTQARFLRRVAGLIDSDYLRARLLDAASVEEVRETVRVGETSASV